MTINNQKAHRVMNFEFNPSEVSLFEVPLMLWALRFQFWVRLNFEDVFQITWVVGMIKPASFLTLDEVINDWIRLNWVLFVKFILVLSLKAKE